jgi:hypothetical protein
MAEESQLEKPSPGRPLRSVERELVQRMLAGNDAGLGSDRKLSSSLVEDMQDGGMGSIRFLMASASSRRLGKPVASAEYTDGDGVLVNIVINVDQESELYEVDFWKVDFSPLRRYPRASEIRLETVKQGSNVA